MMTALVCALLCALLLFADLISKTIVFASDVSQTKYFLDIVKINTHENHGMMLGIWNKSPSWVMDLVTAITAVMIVGIVVLFFTAFKRNKPARVCLAIIEAGAIGNFIDRICLNYVRDFIDVKSIWFIPGYICNVADICIMLGAIVLIFVILFIGPGAVFPLTKKWRAQGRLEDEEKLRRKEEKAQKKQEKRNQK